MRNILPTILVILFLTTSCSYHYYYNGSVPKKETVSYDRSAPDIRLPELERAGDKYDPTDYNTFPVYTKLHTVEAPVSEAVRSKDAIWCTKKGTYLVSVSKMLWNERYYQTQSSYSLRDSRSGKIYPLVRVWGLPVDTTYWMHSVAGEWFCRVFEFPPLEPECTHIDIVYSKGKPLEHIKGTTGWGRPDDELNISVAELQANQPKMKYKPTVIVK